MRKVLLSSLAALALIAGSALNSTTAKAFSVCPQTPGYGAVAAPAIGAAVGLADIDIIAAGAGGAANFSSGFVVGYPLLLVAIVGCDIVNGGLDRKFAEVTPGAGYIVASADTSKITPAPRYMASASDLGAIDRAKSTHSFNVAMGYADDEQTTKYLASASR